MYRSTFLLLMLALTFVAGCSFAPDYKVPALSDTPPNYGENGDWVKATPLAEMPKGSWWEMFGDPRLNELENGVTNGNQNLKEAVAVYDEARAASSVARADYFPTVTGSTAYTHEKISQTAVNSRSVPHFDDFLLGADLSYEIDVWGRVRNAVHAAESLAEASAADLAMIDLALHTELATDYIALRGDDAAQAILDRTIEVDQKAYAFTGRRFTGGVSPELDVDQAQTQMENAKTQAADMRLHRSQLEHAIAILTGKLPAAFHQDAIPLKALVFPLVESGLPSTLLQRRPDIAAAERRANAANAEIGVTRAAYFPRFSLSAIFGYESGSASNWLTAPSQFWMLGPSAAATLFDAGRMNALTDEAKAQYNQAAATYRQTVLSAYQDVEDNLAALHYLTNEGISQTTATRAAQRALAQERNLYRGGATTYLDVATSENTALQAELADVNIQVRRLSANVMLVKALGGGYQMPQGGTQGNPQPRAIPPMLTLPLK
jgi:NodT family efflux transporter outer membrane factor (OMF) lipoprotein